MFTTPYIGPKEKCADERFPICFDAWSQMFMVVLSDGSLCKKKQYTNVWFGQRKYQK